MSKSDFAVSLDLCLKADTTIWTTKIQMQSDYISAPRIAQEKQIEQLNLEDQTKDDLNLRLS